MSSAHPQKRAKVDKNTDVADKIVVAIKASKKIPKKALVWALTHVVRPGGSISLLVVIPKSSGRRFWGLPKFSGDCSEARRKYQCGGTGDQKPDIPDSYSQMMLQLHDVYDSNKINIKIVSGSPYGAVAAECRRIQANWVILDRQLKHEEKCCLEELQCNIAVMKHSQAKILRLNLVGNPEADTQISYMQDQPVPVAAKSTKDPRYYTKRQTVMSSTSTELEALFTATEERTSSLLSSGSGSSPFSSAETNDRCNKEKNCTKDICNLQMTSSDSDNESSSPSKIELQPWMSEVLGGGYTILEEIEEMSQKLDAEVRISKAKAMLEKYSKLDSEVSVGSLSYPSNLNFRGNVREVILLARNAPSGPPPLCSICQHKTPVFGKPPKWFKYSELELATGGFSQANFLAEGGFGSVHRGVLPDGQAIAVKQHKIASSQGDQEFCSEVDVLSCAQHRNVVMLIGFCIEESRRLLVYEYICNGSLDSHLYGYKHEPLEWPARQKIAVGAARGLRYLHEECRVGCIVHRDMRPNNILLTHDFEPLVGDFGLARWQAHGDLGVETRVIGTIGYLAPEYAQSGQITEKADVYSFGVVLLELVTGRKAVDINRPRGQQLLSEWARPLLEQHSIPQLMDPRLGNRYSEQEVRRMSHVASLCIRHDPQARPRMSQVLRMLEGDSVMDFRYSSTPGEEGGNWNRWSQTDEPRQQRLGNPIPQEDKDAAGAKRCYEDLRGAAWG